MLLPVTVMKGLLAINLMKWNFYFQIGTLIVLVAPMKEFSISHHLQVTVKISVLLFLGQQCLLIC